MNCDCPICFEEITTIKNSITTDCGHQFHANCLMKNVAHNGFNCPCCRTTMAENPQQSDAEDDNDDDESDDSSYPNLEDDTLRGLRLFTSRIEGEEPDQEDVVTEYQYLNYLHDERDDNQQRPIPSLDLVIKKLQDHGVTFRQLVASHLTSYEEYENQDELERIESDLWGTMRTIISNYEPAQEASLLQEPVVVAPEPVPSPEPEPAPVAPAPAPVAYPSFLSGELCDLVIGPSDILFKSQISEIPGIDDYYYRPEDSWYTFDNHELFDDIDDEICRLLINV